MANDINLAALWVPVMPETKALVPAMKKAGEESQKAFADGFKSGGGGPSPEQLGKDYASQMMRSFQSTFAGLQMPRGMHDFMGSLEAKTKVTAGQVEILKSKVNTTYAEWQAALSKVGPLQEKLIGLQQQHNKAVQEGNARLATFQQSRVSQVMSEHAAATATATQKQDQYTTATAKLSDAQSSATQGSNLMAAAIGGGIGAAASLAVVGITELIGAVTHLVTGAFKLGIEAAKELTNEIITVGESYEALGIQIETFSGATGTAMEELKASTANAFGNLDTEGKDFGRTMATLSTTLHVVGDPLEQLGSHVEMLKGRFGALDVSALTAAFQQFGVEGKDLDSVLASVAQSATNTSTPINDIVTALARNSAILVESGLNMQQAGAYIADLTGKGLPATTMLTGMQSAAKEFNKQGWDMEEGMKHLIQRFSEIDDVQKSQLSQDVFGTSRWADGIRMAESYIAIVNQAPDAFNSSSEALDQFKEDTQGLAEKWTELKHKAEEALSPLGEAAVDAIGTTLDKLSTMVTEHHDEIFEKVKGFGDMFIENLPLIQAFAADTIQILGVMGDAVGLIFGGLMFAMGTFFGEIGRQMDLLPDFISKLIPGYDEIQNSLKGMGGEFRGIGSELTHLGMTDKTKDIADWIKGLKVDVPKTKDAWHDLVDGINDATLEDKEFTIGAAVNAPSFAAPGTPPGQPSAPPGQPSGPPLFGPNVSPPPTNSAPARPPSVPPAAPPAAPPAVPPAGVPQRPAGAAPPGMTWDYWKGRWISTTTGQPAPPAPGAPPPPPVAASPPASQRVWAEMPGGQKIQTDRGLAERSGWKILGPSDSSDTHPSIPQQPSIFGTNLGSKESSAPTGPNDQTGFGTTLPGQPPGSGPSMAGMSVDEVRHFLLDHPDMAPMARMMFPGQGFQSGGTVLGIGQSAGIGSGAESWRSTVRSVLASVGPNYGIQNFQEWEDAIIRQIQTESSGNANVGANTSDSNAIAGTPSKGLLQFIDSTYASNNILGAPIADPVGQIAALIPYVLNKYGQDASGGPNFIGQGHGYAAGGTIAGAKHWEGAPNAHDTVPIWAEPGEEVINARSAAKHRALLQYINADAVQGVGMQGGGQVGVQQVIWSNPATGYQVGSAGGEYVGPGTSQPGYYAADFGGHTGHVHTSFFTGLNGEPYGLPIGSDVRQGASGFPAWVYTLGAMYGVEGSTYPGHQESSGYNRGIDWWPIGHSDMSGATYTDAERSALDTFAAAMAASAASQSGSDSPARSYAYAASSGSGYNSPGLGGQPAPGAPGSPGVPGGYGNYGATDWNTIAQNEKQIRDQKQRIADADYELGQQDILIGEKRKKLEKLQNEEDNWGKRKATQDEVDAAQNDLNEAIHDRSTKERERGDAATDLTTIEREAQDDLNKRKKPEKQKKATGVEAFSQLGGGLLSGVADSLGLGEIFDKPPWEWGIVKLATGLANWGFGTAEGWANQVGQGKTGIGGPGWGNNSGTPMPGWTDSAGGPGWSLGGLNIPGINPQQNVSNGPNVNANNQIGVQGTGPAPGPPGTVVNGDFQPLNVQQNGMQQSDVEGMQHAQNASNQVDVNTGNMPR